MPSHGHMGVMNEWAADYGITTAEFVAANPGIYAPAPRTVWLVGRRVEVPDQAAIVRVMARLMADGQAADGACTEDHLFAAGFTRAELRDHAEQARTMARRHVGDHHLADDRPPARRRRRR